MRPIVPMCLLLAGAAALALSGCTSHADSDGLTIARRNLRIVPCGAASAVAGVAGVYKASHSVYLGDWIIVSVCHLEELLKAAEAEQKPVSLFVEGLDSGNEPTGVDLDAGLLTFVLDRNEDNRQLWKPLLYNPLFDPTASIRVSVGIHGGRPLPRAAGANLTLSFHKLFIDWSIWLWLAILLTIIVTFLRYAHRSDLLRDGPAIGGVRQPYSLGRAQMGWWFFLVLVSYNFIWLVTSDTDTIPATVLALMGISAATALASVAITSRRTGGARQKLLQDEIDGIDEALLKIAVDLDDAARRAADPVDASSATTAAALRQALEKKRTELQALRAKLVLEQAGLSTIVASRGFWNDLVTDDRGAVSLDRFQIAAWTLVLGGVFLGSVIWELTMPEFNATLLALMGVSSGTYIGFKLPSRSEK